MKTSELLDDRKENLAVVLKECGKTQEEHDEYFGIIKEWLKTQPHLPETPMDELISNALIRCKFSVEKCKQTLDYYYTIRSLMPDMFNRSSEKLDKVLKIIDEQEYFLPMPKLTDQGHRIVYSMHFSDPKELDAVDTLIHRCVIFEIRYMEDCVTGDIFVEDLSKFQLGHMTKYTPMVVKKAVTMYETVYNNRMKKVVFINTPSYFDTLFGMIRRLMKPKLAARMHCYKDAEILKELIPEDRIPSEYGGTGPSIDTLRKLWKQKVEESRPKLIELDKLRSEEHKRPIPLINDEVLGYYGNFKKINID